MNEVSESVGGSKNRGRLVVGVCIVALVILAWLMFPSPGKPKQLPPSTGFSTPVAASSLSSTRMLPFTSEPIQAGENQVYCPTMALAWTEFDNPLRFKTHSKTIAVRSFGVTSEWKKWGIDDPEPSQSALAGAAGSPIASLF